MNFNYYTEYFITHLEDLYAEQLEKLNLNGTDIHGDPSADNNDDEMIITRDIFTSWIKQTLNLKHRDIIDALLELWMKHQDKEKQLQNDEEESVLSPPSHTPHTQSSSSSSSSSFLTAERPKVNKKRKSAGSESSLGETAGTCLR